MKVVYKFVPTKQMASKELTSVKKHIDSAKIEQNYDGMWLVLLGEVTTQEQADKLIRKTVSYGYWGGVYTPKI